MGGLSDKRLEVKMKQRVSGKEERNVNTEGEILVEGGGE